MMAHKHWGSSKESSAVRRTLLSCFKGWIEIAYDKALLQSLPGHFILSAAFAGLGDKTIRYDCVEVLQAVMGQIRSPKEDFEIFQYLEYQVLSFLDKAVEIVGRGNSARVASYLVVLTKFGKLSAS